MSYPLTFSIEYPEKLSRGILILRFFLGIFYVGIPHGICLLLLGIAEGFIQFCAFWVILFTGKYPKSMFDFVIGYYRWEMRVSAYLGYMTDKYPKFTTQSYEGDPIILDLDYPESLSRGKLILKTLLGWAYVCIPHIVVLFFVSIWACILSFIAWWAILFTGKFPEKWFHFIEDCCRWELRLDLFFFCCDVYPPFSLK